MTATITERFESRQIEIGDSSSITREYIIQYDDLDEIDDLVAEAAFVAALDAQYGGFGMASYSLKIFAFNKWFGTVTYASDVPDDTDRVLTFDTSGGSEHISQSLATPNRYPAGTAPDFSGAINATGQDVEGVDIVVPVYSFSELHYKSNARVDEDYRFTLEQLTGRVNDKAFRNWERGEVLFLGASGQRRGTDNWELTFQFAGSRNRTDLVVGSMTNIEKEGWQYLWVRYQDAVDATAKMMVKEPQSVHIEQVYEYGDFDLLDL